MNMKLGTHRYVPVLKMKRGEKSAMAALSSDVQRSVVPLLEVVQRTEKDLAAHLDTAFKGLSESVMNFEVCLLDTRELAPDGETGAEEVFGRAEAEGIRFIPVTGISRRHDVAPSIRYRTNGLALRITRGDYESGDLTNEIDKFCATHQLDPEGIDLIVDMGPVEDMIDAGVEALARALISSVPFPNRWRNLILSGCSFPISMATVDRNSYRKVERTEWIVWRERLFSDQSGLHRVPTFSDCAIQHPSGVEGFNPRTMQASASIRYAVDREWVLIKGEGSRSIPLRDQFPDLANRLINGDLRQHFAGREHCGGCRDASNAAAGLPRLGSAEVWRKIGTIHHITTVAGDQLSNLSSP